MSVCNFLFLYLGPLKIVGPCQLAHLAPPSVLACPWGVCMPVCLVMCVWCIGCAGAQSHLKLKLAPEPVLCGAVRQRLCSRPTNHVLLHVES